MGVIPTASGSEESLDYARKTKGLAMQSQAIDFMRSGIVRR
jgi:hypothetical protein